MSREDDRFDAAFEDLKEGLQDLADLDETDVLDVSQLNRYELTTGFNERKQRLYQLTEETGHNQLVWPNTDEARQLHSEYYAYLGEIKKRGIRGGETHD